MFSSLTDSLPRSLLRGPRKDDLHAQVYNPPKDNAIIHYFASTAQGGVKGEFKKFFVPAFRSSPPFHLSSTPKPAQTLDFTAYRGVCPQSDRVTGTWERVMGMLAEKISPPPFVRRPPPLRDPPRGWANEASNHYFHSLFRMDLSQFRLKFFSPPKK